MYIYIRTYIFICTCKDILSHTYTFICMYAHTIHIHTLMYIYHTIAAAPSAKRPFGLVALKVLPMSRWRCAAATRWTEWPSTYIYVYE